MDTSCSCGVLLLYDCVHVLAAPLVRKMKIGGMSLGFSVVLAFACWFIGREFESRSRGNASGYCLLVSFIVFIILMPSRNDLNVIDGTLGSSMYSVVEMRLPL